MLKINLGCGDKKLPNYVNVDISGKCDPDVIWDLTKIPYPDKIAKEGTVERVECDNLIEHLDRQQVIDVLNEIHRLLKDGGTLWIKSPAIHRAGMNDPYSMYDGVFGDPTHRSFFTERTFDYWSKADPMRRWHNFGKDYGILPFSKLTKKFTGIHGTWELTK